MPRDWRLQPKSCCVWLKQIVFFLPNLVWVSTGNDRGRWTSVPDRYKFARVTVSSTATDNTPRWTPPFGMCTKVEDAAISAVEGEQRIRLKMTPTKSVGGGSNTYTDGPAKQVASGKGATAETKREEQAADRSGGPRRGWRRRTDDDEGYCFHSRTTKIARGYRLIIRKSNQGRMGQ
ncbi:hypothetical protein B296_00014469 [Ensete ventricosum]|uniref:Uncharacterized protein n=1 Tax=Ensete ventricosum TaxID=4639 RepID=A0A427AHQ9_ENSVE|nr:hypothetical protein B296_00014469 [Ensete ventricosum]